MLCSCLLFVVVEKEAAAGWVGRDVDIAAAGNRRWPIIGIRRRLKTVTPRHFPTIPKRKSAICLLTAGIRPPAHT